MNARAHVSERIALHELRDQLHVALRQSSPRATLSLFARLTETPMAGVIDERRIVGDMHPSVRERAHAEIVFLSVAASKTLRVE